MNPKLTIAGALALLVPVTAPAAAFAQDWSGSSPPPAAQRGYTELRITPPQGGRVYVYDGHRLLGRFDRDGVMLVTSGRGYRVVAMRGDTKVWAGDVMAAGSPIELRWAEQPRAREPLAPPRYEQAPPRYEQAPPRHEQRGREAVISSAELRSLLRELEATPEDQDRLDALAGATSRHAFTTSQASPVLGRFHSDAYRLAALERLQGRLVDREDARTLTWRFRSPSARRFAEEMLGW